MKKHKHFFIFITIFLIYCHRGTSDNFTVSRQHVGEDNCPSLENGDIFTQSEFLSRLVDVCRYDKLLRPGSDQPLNVSARTYVYFMQASEAHDMYFDVHFLLQLRFYDPRLKYDTYSPSRRVIIGEELLFSSIWTPHIFLANEQRSIIMGTDKKDVLVSINPEGMVLFSRRFQAMVYCWMNLQKFPFDEQVCSINFESWMYNSNEVRLFWETTNSVTLAPELHLSEFSVMEQWVDESLVIADWSNPRHGGFIGNYSALTFHFRISREIGYYMLEYFIPSIMIVAISWVSFWLHPDAAPPRVTLGTSTMLSFITLAANQGKTITKVSYIKVSEVWFLGCTAFIFGSLVEFAFVNIIWRRKKDVVLKQVNSKYILKSTLTPRLARKEFAQSQTNLNNSNNSNNSQMTATSLDSAVDKGRRSPTNIESNNYLTVHGTSPTFNIPSITADDVEIIHVPKQEDNKEKHTWTTMTPQEISTWIDKRSRVAFPVAFLVFNITYFSFVYVL